MDFPFTLDKFQLDAINSINNDRNVLACIGTGSGKTVIAKYAIDYFLKQNKKVIYTSPIKSLSNQKYAEFKQDFPDLGIMTGDIKFNPEAKCVIMTTEILRNMLYKNNDCSNNDCSDIGCIIFDEVHYINNEDRGKVWEESIILLPNHILMVMLSATIKNPEKFSNWLNSIKDRQTDLIIKEDRVIPLTHYYYIDTDNSLLEVLSSNNVFNTINYDKVCKMLPICYNYKSIMGPFITFLKHKNLLPALFFSFSRKNCELYALSVQVPLLDHLEVAEIETIFELKMRSLDHSYSHMTQYHDIKKLLLKGIGIHHSGLVPVLKEIVEILFSKGLIKILFATETFAVGVNMPTKTVVFTELTKYDGKNGLRNLKTDEYLQMAGRAGRRGLDKIGTVIHLCLRDLLSRSEMVTIMVGSMPEIVSKFKLSYQFLLKAIYYKKDGTSIMDFIGSTLMEQENSDSIGSLIQECSNKNNKLLSIVYDKNILNEYIKIYEQLQLGNLLKIKQRKCLEKKLKEFDNVYFEIYNCIKDINNLNKHIILKQDYIKQTINNMLQMLQECDFISGDIDINEKCDYKNKILVKGLVAMEINECNEILFTEMIYSKLLDDLDVPMIVGIIGSFIDEKLDDEFTVPISFVNIIGKLENISVRLMDKEYVEINTNWKVNKEFVEIAYIWASGKSIQDIYKISSIYEGNFIKGIIKINKICESLINICSILQNDVLCKKVLQIESLLIRDIVNIESLYIKNY